MKYKKRFLWALLAPLAASLVQPVVSSVIKGISGRGFRRAGRGYADKKFLVSLYSNPSTIPRLLIIWNVILRSFS